MNSCKRQQEYDCKDSGLFDEPVAHIAQACIFIRRMEGETRQPRFDLSQVAAEIALKSVEPHEHDREEDDIDQDDGYDANASPLKPDDFL